MKLTLKNTDKDYGLIARGLHWTSALIVLALLSLGFYMAGLEVSPFKFSLYFWHKSFGILVLVLVALRLGWRLYNPPPEPIESQKKWEHALAKIVHILLYFGLIAMPLSGWFMSSAGDFPAPFFGLFNMPDFIPKDEALFRLFGSVHEYAAFALIVAVGLHALGAIKHHLLDKDETLTRMGGHTVIIPAAVILLALPVFLIAKDKLSEKPHDHSSHHEQEGHHEHEHEHHQDHSGDHSSDVHAVQSAEEDEFANPPSDEALQGVSGDTKQIVTENIPADVQFWKIIPGESYIKFQATQSGQPFEGSFGEFDGQIYFDPENLSASQVDIAINIASIKTGSDDRDGQARGVEWFDVNKFPKAYFQARTFENDEAAGANHFIAKGYLTLKGISVPVSLPFKAEFSGSENDGKKADVQATLTLDRLDFGIGQGQWKSTDTIGKEVKITIAVRAEAAVATPR
ncbi:MAG TPA: hypothetical protein DEA55_09150 [Rhodospirillaceae bacterium]|nr:hypothetical protein [Rhodospirillaceae bacterium]